jgi:threonine synthase
MNQHKMDKINSVCYTYNHNDFKTTNEDIVIENASNFQKLFKLFEEQEKRLDIIEKTLNSNHIILIEQNVNIMGNNEILTNIENKLS